MRVVAAAIDSVGGAMNSIGGAMGFMGGAISTIADLSKLHKKTPVHIDFVRELLLFYNSKNVIVSQSHFLFPNLQIDRKSVV